MTQLPIENASVVVINFTLQFIEPEARQQLINQIYQGLNPGGILILSEKLHFDAPNYKPRLSISTCNLNVPMAIRNWKLVKNAPL